MSDRWTVRGVPAELQNAVAASAKAADMTVGKFLTGILQTQMAEASLSTKEARRYNHAINNMNASASEIIKIQNYLRSAEPRLCLIEKKLGIASPESPDLM